MDDQFFEHTADIGIEGRGPTIEAAFERAAHSMFSIISDPSAVQPHSNVKVEFDEEDEEFALVIWLNELLSTARSQGLVFTCFRLTRQASKWSGEAWGEPWRDDLPRGVEVKGATLTGLSVRREGEEWVARCVVDV
jgi:SHS2 domain-containing protein